MDIRVDICFLFLFLFLFASPLNIVFASQSYPYLCTLGSQVYVRGIQQFPMLEHRSYFGVSCLLARGVGLLKRVRKIELGERGEGRLSFACWRFCCGCRGKAFRRMKNAFLRDQAEMRTSGTCTATVLVGLFLTRLFFSPGLFVVVLFILVPTRLDCRKGTQCSGSWLIVIVFAAFIIQLPLLPSFGNAVLGLILGFVKAKFLFSYFLFLLCFSFWLFPFLWVFPISSASAFTYFFSTRPLVPIFFG